MSLSRHQVAGWLYLLILAALLPFILTIDLDRWWILLVLPALPLAQRLTHGRFYPVTPLNPSIFILLVMVGVSVWATPDLVTSLGHVAALLHGIVLFWVLLSLFQTLSEEVFWPLALAAITGCALFVVAMGLLGTEFPAKFPVITPAIEQFKTLMPNGLFSFNPNRIAGALLWVIPVQLVMSFALLRGRRLIYILAGLVSAILAAVALLLMIMTQSRGGLLGLGVGMAVMAMIVVGRRRPWGAASLLGLGFMVCVLILVLPAWRDLVFVNLGLNPTQSGGEINTLAGRLEIWSRALYALEDFPFTGLGMNIFSDIVPILYPTFIISPQTPVNHAHNLFLQTGVDLGLPGLVAYLAIWLISGWIVVSMVRVTRGRPWLDPLVIGCAGSLAAFFAFGLLDTIELGARPGFIFWVLLAVAAGAQKFAR